jgi:dipeptidyl aminopeptidase/acylaminoacyl peptidase
VTETPAWERRFRAPQIGFPAWCTRFPDRLAFVSNESGSWQAWVVDRGTGEKIRVSDEPIGVEQVLVAPDGRIVWWRDDVGNEQGRWMVLTPGDEPAPLLTGVPDGWGAGISFADGGAIAFGVVVGREYRAYLSEPDQAPLLLLSSDRPLGVGREDPLGSGGLSADGRLVCVSHSERGDAVHNELRILDPRAGIVDEVWDPGSNLNPAAWSQVEGDQRLLFTSELGAFERPAIWEGPGERRDLTVDLAGAVIPIGWWPDGSAILARQEHEGVDRLVKVDPGSGEAILLIEVTGEVLDAAVRPDGAVWHLSSDSSRVPRVVDGEGNEVLVPAGEPAPSGRPYRSFWFENPQGQRVQTFVVTPDGEGPWPTVMVVHGGPAWHERGAFDPETLAFVDAGYAVVVPNYRGSTGYGIGFRRALIGDPWFPETEDVIACLDGVIAERIADPARVAFSGWSWGGCLACLCEGLHPERWRAVFAGIPSGDLVAAHYACMPSIREWDLALYGGSPDDLPEFWAERNPMTYVDRAQAPVLVIAGEQDPRCPIEGITPWVDALSARGIPVEVHLYPEGHHASRTDEQVRHMQLILDFFARYV